MTSDEDRKQLRLTKTKPQKSRNKKKQAARSLMKE